MFQTRVDENIRPYILYLIRFSRKSCSSYVEKHGTARQATDGNLRRRIHSACWIAKSTDVHSENVIFIAFPLNNGFANGPQCYVFTYIVLFLSRKPIYLPKKMDCVLCEARNESSYTYIYTGCPRRNEQNFGRVFLMLNYTDITQNTYIQS